MDVPHPADAAVSRIAAAIGVPARTRMLFCLMDGLARTSTELAIVAEVAPSTASVHLKRLLAENLVKVLVQGRHRYYGLAGANVARVLERLSVLGGEVRTKFVPNTPERLHAARTCYDHMAGAVAVCLHDRFLALRWIGPSSSESRSAYELTRAGAKALQVLGIDIEAARVLRRRFAYGCLDWSERRPHVGGALGAAMLRLMFTRKWVSQELDSRALSVTPLGQREMRNQFGMEL
jgi:DNA-binding transcriptional ArsR family regulator